MAPENDVSGPSASPISVWSGWTCSAHRPGTIAHPAQLDEAHADWLRAAVPGTVAAALEAAGRWSFDRPTEFDADDWWFRTSFTTPLSAFNQPCHLCFDGLATLAKVWLNGELLLTSDNMFRSNRVNVSSYLRPENEPNELVIEFRSVTDDLQRKRPRPRWKTNLVNHQQLRWHRTSLQGRIPGWSPPVPAIGPWRDVRLESSLVLLEEVHLVPRVKGTSGLVTVQARVATTQSIRRAVLRVGSMEGTLSVRTGTDGNWLTGELRVPNPSLWWPHTHGQPSLHECELVIDTDDAHHRFKCPNIGFRSLDVQTENSFSISVNGEPIYCRGACWTVSDILTLAGSEDSLRRDLTLARDAGTNMLRVGGTMVYESDSFYRLCDELGILVWQDFQFANMDYPVEDESFRANITVESTQQLQRLAPHPSVAVYCGNSEIEQQAAMLGMPRQLWRNAWFGEQLPALCSAHHPGTAYVPSTPTGGALPFHANSGLTHYYGVGAYLRPVNDVRRSDVKFTPECLGFANVPEPSIIDAITGGSHAMMHSPKWKQRVPRDTGAGWDFEDVRDHYLRELYGVDPVSLRSSDTPRYLQLSRLVSGEMMSQTFSEWRSGHGHNRGGLVWFYKDLWPAAGWGIVDSNGMPKAAYYFLKRTWQPLQLTVTDEGLNGIHLHLTNETDAACDGFVEITLLKEPHVAVARQEVAVHLAGRSRQTLNADEILGGFYDSSYAYRFGPPQHDVVIAAWLDSQRRVVSEAFHFIRRNPSSMLPVARIEAIAEQISDTRYAVSLKSDRFLHGVRLTANGFLPDDNYFHLAPQRTKTVLFNTVRSSQTTFKATVEALNSDAVLTVTAPKRVESTGD